MLNNIEYKIAGVSKNNWESYMEDVELYYRRATGVTTDPKEIICEVLKKFNIIISDDKINNLVSSRINRFRNSLLYVDPIIIQTLNQIKQKNIPMAIISDADFIDVMYWEDSPLSKFFVEAVFSYKIGCTKHNKKIYTDLLNRLKINASDGLFVGDGGSNEIETAKSLGMKTALVTHFSSLHSNEKADFVIDHFEELSSIVLRMAESEQTDG
jgi:putative hydrolase of the HAD superfamily